MTVAYDGTNYLGWQKTKEGPSIEEALQGVLARILQEEITLQAASRTDAGVHAKGQIVNFFTSTASINNIQTGLNCLLPKDIIATNVEVAQPSFHPTLNCIGKEYHYFVCDGTAQAPEHRLYSWHCPHSLDVSAMRTASQFFLGKHDFSAFCNLKKKQAYVDYHREIKTLDIEVLPEKRLRFRIIGNHFLYKMVRNIVGTLVYVGKKKICVNDVFTILSSHERKFVPLTAPSHGLFLHQVFY